MLTTEATPAPTEAVQETKVVYTTAGQLEQTLKDEAPEAFFRENKIQIMEITHETGRHSVHITFKTGNGYVYLPWMDATTSVKVEVAVDTTSIVTTMWYIIIGYKAFCVRVH